MKALALPCSVEGCTNKAMPGHPDKVCRECFNEQRLASREAKEAATERRARSFREALTCATPKCKNAARVPSEFCTVCLAIAKRGQEQRAAAERAAPFVYPAAARAAAEAWLQSMPPAPATVVAVAVEPRRAVTHPPTPPNVDQEPPPVVVEQPAPPPPPEPEPFEPAPPATEETMALDSAPRRTDNPTPSSMTATTTPDFVPQDLYLRFRKLRREMDKVPELNGRKQWPQSIHVDVVQLAAEAATMTPPISNSRAAELLGIHQSLITQWGKIHKMPTGSSRPVPPRRAPAKAKPAAAAPPARAAAPSKPARAGSELELLRRFADDVDAILRVHARGKILDAPAALDAIRSALNEIMDD